MDSPLTRAAEAIEKYAGKEALSSRCQGADVVLLAPPDRDGIAASREAVAGADG